MWKHKLMLEEGETLQLESKRDKGHLGQETVELYAVLSADGRVIGEVQYVDHASIKSPFRNSFHLVQRKEGRTILDERWSS